MKFGETLKERRIDLGFTMKSVADKSGMTSPFLSDIERGKRLLASVEKFNRIVEVLQLEGNKWELLYQLCFERNNIELVMICELLGGNIEINLKGVNDENNK